MTNSSSFATLFNTFSIAIIFLESQRKVHRDISYTNVLLREPGNNFPKMEKNQKRVMSNLGLAEIEIQRCKFRCREGLLIDFDYGSELAVAQSQKTERNEEDSKEDEEDRLTIGHCANKNDSGVRMVGPF
jgi:serine/threonine protein kinase